jgi:hypothetical protein
MSKAVDQAIRTNGGRINCVDRRAVAVTLPLHSPHESRRAWRAQPSVIAYAGFVPSHGTSEQSNPQV